jgi:hypothetical protein
MEARRLYSAHFDSDRTVNREAIYILRLDHVLKQLAVFKYSAPVKQNTFRIKHILASGL